MDVLQRFIFDNAPVRGEYIFLEHSFQEILSQHPYPPLIRNLLGEALCVSGLLSAIIKFEGRLTVQFRGQGKLKLLLAQCNSNFQVRGLAKWEGEMTETDLMSAFHEGILTIMVDSGSTNRYQGIVNWNGYSLAESVEGYFRDSEQLTTRLWLGGNETSAAGLLLQVIPGQESAAKGMEDADVQSHWERIYQNTIRLQPEQLLSGDYQQLLNHLYPEETVRIFTGSPVSFHCSCSRKRSENAIFILGKDEAEEELKSKNSLVVTCEFCHKNYVFDRKDVATIFENRDKPPTQTRH